MKDATVGEMVFIPTSKFKDISDQPSSFVCRSIRAHQGRKVLVDSSGNNEEWIATSMCHRNIGVLLLTIGDFDTERHLLNPLSKSMLHYLRLLLPDEFVKHFHLRTTEELKFIWEREHAVISHIVLVGHGSEAALKFGVGGWKAVEEFFGVFQEGDTTPKNFISLCCETGFKSFAGVASSYNVCERMIAPFHSVHGAIASQFAQSFLNLHMIEGQTANTAFGNARRRTTGGASFRLWRNGELVAGPR